MKIRWNPKQFVHDMWMRLRQLRDAPHAVAGGVAIGIFWGFTPLTGLKTLLSIFTAWVTRCSKIPAVIAVSLHDVLVPVWPIILRWEYQIGYWIINRPHQFPPRLSVGKIHMSELFRWKTLEVLWPTFIGSLVIGIPIALICYFILKSTLERYETSHHRHLTPPA
ncbi:MAG TPA: DUF2062 domain-containing protein [Chthoniobacter sp.]|nr:DUF2062 domain-containing protein [Chthoniobacter sp.]